MISGILHSRHVDADFSKVSYFPF